VLSAAARDPHALRECRRVLRAHSRSFALAARLYPPGVRDEVAAIYAWCRRCDDAIDLAPPAAQPAELERLRAELDAIYAGAPQPDPIGRAFARVVLTRGIPPAYARALLDGMEMDVRGTRYAELADLRLYAHRVAGSVGLLLCHVMGVSDARALPHAAHLGIAMQLTNVARDVEEDLLRGRVYLPDALLGRAADAVWRARGGPVPAALAPALARAIRALLDEAERHYASADRGLAYLSRRSALAVRTARRVYAAIGDELRRRGCDPRAGRAVVPTARQLALLAGAVAESASPRARHPRATAAPDRELRFDEVALE
jgi:phytoene synthase